MIQKLLLDPIWGPILANFIAGIMLLTVEVMIEKISEKKKAAQSQWVAFVLIISFYHH